MAAGAAPGRPAEQEAAVEAPAEEEDEEVAAAAPQSFKELVRGGRSRCRSLPQPEGPGGAAGAGGGHVRGAALPGPARCGAVAAPGAASRPLAPIPVAATCLGVFLFSVLMLFARGGRKAAVCVGKVACVNRGGMRSRLLMAVTSNGCGKI